MENILLLLLTITGPALLAAVALMSRFNIGPRTRYLLTASRLATGTTLLLAIAIAIYVARYGSTSSGMLGIDPIAFSLRLDSLSATLFALVAFVGVIVVQFSRNYLAGEKRQGVFLGRLCLTLCAVSMLVLSGSLLQLFVAWVGTSVALHRLLLYYSDRPRAVAAARKKFICARIGDAFLFLAAMLLYLTFGTGDLTQLLKVAREMSHTGDTPLSAQGAALSIVLAAVFKSAQFPVHGWLTEVMETPTPVSALLHAGIVNAGGFLVIRFSDLIVLSSLSMNVLILIGGVTALVGTVVMLTQTNVKSSLAWSTVSQMGFMLLQCGFGAFAAATLHIVAHSLYKAHAFLASGSAVEAVQNAPGRTPAVGPRPRNLLAAVVTSSLLLIAAGFLWGVSPAEKPALVALGAILVMGLTLFCARGLSGRHGGFVSGQVLLTVATGSWIYFGLQQGAAWVMGDVVPTASTPGYIGTTFITVLLVLFGVVSFLQLYGRAWAHRWPGVYVHVANGFYANTMFDRLIGSYHAPVAEKN